MTTRQDSSPHRATTLFPGRVAVAGTSSRRQISGLIPASTTRS